MKIGSRLRKFQEDNFPGDIEGFSRAVGYSRQMVNKYFNDETFPSGEFLVSLINLGCDLNLLLSESSVVKEKQEDYFSNEHKYEQCKKDLDLLKSLVAEIKKKIIEFENKK